MPRQLPAHLSDLLRRRHCSGATVRSFIEQYDSKKERMQAIARELMDLSKTVKKTQKKADGTISLGTVLGGLAIAVGIGAALETGAEKMAILGGLAAVGGGAAAIIAAVVAKEAQTATETKRLKIVEELGKEFMGIIELHEDILKDIMVVSEELEEKSSSLTTTRAQTKEILIKTILQQVLKQTAELSERIREVMDVTLAMQSQVRELPNCIVSVAGIIKTPEHDAKLRNCITDSALQCEKTIDEFAKMRDMLEDFEEMQTE